MNPFIRYKLLFSALLFLIFAAGCAKSDSTEDGSETAAATASADMQYFSPGPDIVAGSHILIAYAGAMRADSAIVRTKEEALEKARGLIEELKADPSKFEALARENSDGPTGPTGGDLGTWQKGQMVPEFDNAMELLEVGGISEEPVETAFGYHVMRRNDTRAAHYGGDAFIIAVAGRRGVPATVTRDSADTATLAAEIGAKINSDNFETLATEYNDYGEGEMFIGAFKDGDPSISPDIMALLKSLSFDEVGGPLELPVGFAFIKRTRLEQRAGSHILIAYAGAMRAGSEVTRTKEEARAEAERVLKLCKENPDNFADLASEYSDGPTGAGGGDLGVWFRGVMAPEFDEAIDHLEAGEITDEPIETDFGFHIIKRNEVQS